MASTEPAPGHTDNSKLSAVVRVEYLALQLLLLQAIEPPSEMTDQTAALDLAYANLASSSVHGPSRSTFHEIVTRRYGWSNDEFNEWAGSLSKTVWLP